MIRRYQGGCLCGDIRFEAVGPAGNPHSCSCRICQRHTGALTVLWVEFPADRIVWTGPAGTPSTYRSSDVSSRAFCPTCGSTLGALDDAPVVALLVGTFDDSPRRSSCRPSTHSPTGGRHGGMSRSSRTRQHRSSARPQNSLAPFGTSRSGANSTTAPSSSGKPRVSTSDMTGPIWRGGKFTTAATCRPMRSSGA